MEFFSVAGHSVANVFRSMGLADELSYIKVYSDAAKKIGIDAKKSWSGPKIEEEISKKIVQDMMDKMTPEQCAQLEEELAKEAQKLDKAGAKVGTGVTLAALVAAQASGFTVYLLASTALGAITSTLGITLPFAVYTAMSSTIAVVIGPVGWAGLGIFAIYKLGNTNYKKLIPAIVAISALRNKQKLGL